MPELTAQRRKKKERRVRLLAILLAGVLAILPELYGLLAASSGRAYLGFQTNTDDHMVYAAWIRQAMDGHFLMDNRFTTDVQPGLTVHLYFFGLGLLAKLVGVLLAATIGRVIFSMLFAYLAFDLIKRLANWLYVEQLALTFVFIGGGMGFLVWHNFGQAIVRSDGGPIGSLLNGKLPVDVWQPEGFVLPSIITNGLFMVSLCLILFVFRCLLKAQESWKPVPWGALALMVLMNIHSYDVLLVALVMVGFLGISIYQKSFSPQWAVRALCIALGAVPAALWFVHVLKSDPVFQARAATPTYAANFRQVLFGYLPMVALGLMGMLATSKENETVSRRRYGGVGLITALLLVLFVLAGDAPANGYFLSPVTWGLVFALAVAGVVLVSNEDPVFGLLVSWAVIGMIAMYFPALFQRKLAMGLSIPWAILSSLGLAHMMRKQERPIRNLATVLVILLLGGSSLRWLFRETDYIRSDVSSTTRHPVFLTENQRQILDYLNKQPGRVVVLAVPGSASQAIDSQTKQPIPDEFLAPAMPDLSPIVSGLTGAYTYAGHWSETPDYAKRCSEIYRFFLVSPVGPLKNPMTAGERSGFIRKTGATYAIVPTQEAYPSMPWIQPSALGKIVVPGLQFQLVELKS